MRRKKPRFIGTPNLISHVKTVAGEEYLIVQYRVAGFETVRRYTVHLINVEQGMLDRNPIMEIILPFKYRNRYQNFYKNFLGIFSFLLTTRKIKIPGISRENKRLAISIKQLDRYFRGLRRAYLSRRFDSQSIIMPEID